MTTVDERRAEMRRIGDRHPHVLRSAPQSSSCPPHAVLLHRLASLLTTEDLPPADVRITAQREITVDLTGSELVENGVRRWSAALELDPVTEAPAEVSGFAAIGWTTSGYDGTGTYWTVQGFVLEPTPVTDRFGVGTGPAT